MRGMKRSERIWVDERKGLADEGINVGKDAEDPWEKPNLRLASWVYVTSFVSHVAPFEDLRGAAEQTEPATGAPLPFQDDPLRPSATCWGTRSLRVAFRRASRHRGGTRTTQTSDGSQLLSVSRPKDSGLWVAGPRVTRCFSVFVSYFCSGSGEESLHLLLFHVLTSFNIRVPAEF